MLSKIKSFLFSQNSPEILPHLDDSEFIGKMYHRLLNRRVDPDGLQNYKALLGQGYSRRNMIESIIRSEEFANDIPVILEEFPAGNFASVIPSKNDIERCSDFNRNPDSIVGVDLKADEQLKLLKEFKPFYDEMPHHQQNGANLSEFRYVWDNPSYSPSDAIGTYGMMRHFQPKKIIEVGCGNSSCIMLDTNDRFFNSGIDFTFIEPYPDYLKSLLWAQDFEKASIIPEKVQDVPPSVFESLEENDILFIDSSHVSKAGSDVNYLYLDILPRIKPGVLIHIHDIAYPFEYPQEWLNQGRYWNEQYLLRALLINNPTFEILLFTTYMVHNQGIWIDRNMPRFSEIGGSIWLRRLE